MRYFLFIALFLSNTVSFAINQFPRGCEVTGFTWHEYYLVLSDNPKQTFYLIQNRSDKNIELIRHTDKPVFMSPKLRAHLGPKKWSGFALDEKMAYFQCLEKKDGNISPVKCSEVLEICQYPRVKFALSNMGTYWVATNKPQRKVIRDAISKGLLLRW